MRVAIFVNDVIPGMGIPCSGQGLRAWGLIEGLRAIGIEACVIMRHSMLTGRVKRWNAFGLVVIPDHVIIVNNDNLDETLASFDYVVFHNWAAADGLSKPDGSDVRFVYDFFSATLVEHGFISSEPGYLEGVRLRKLALISQADHFIANGPGRTAYARRFLEELGRDDPVHDMPTCLPWLGETGERSNLLIGGYEQAWAKSPSMDLVDHLARAAPDLQVCKVGGNQHYHFGRSSTLERATAGNVSLYDVLSFEDYIRLNMRSRAFLDVAPLNEERRLSLSTRGVLSIACGCPVVHNAETDLGGWLAEYGAGVALPEVGDIANFDMLSEAMVRAATPAMAEGCRALWEAHFDARTSATGLMEFLGHG